MKTALVYDRVNKWGGAERVLLALHEIFPSAPLFTAVYDKQSTSWANVFSVHPSFLQRIPGASGAHEPLPLLTPLAFESFDFEGYDLVISVTSAEAKNIITRPGTLHICYCLTPTRYLWSGFDQYKKQPGLGAMSTLASVGLRMLAPILRRWDLTAASRPDYYVAISRHVKKRIEKYYHREVSAVIYPPVDTKKFTPKKNTNKTGDYFLTVSRLVSYKRLDVIIRAFNALALPLIVIGSGRQKRELTAIAGPTVQIIDRHLTDSELVLYYEGCRAFVYAADEDFGLAAAEAQAIGKPVIAYRQSGVSEIVAEGITGVLFDEQTPESVAYAVKQYMTMNISPVACRKQVLAMSEEAFAEQIRSLVFQLKNK